MARQTVVAVEAGEYAPSVYLALAVADRPEATVEGLFREEAGAGRSRRDDDVEVGL